MHDALPMCFLRFAAGPKGHYAQPELWTHPAWGILGTITYTPQSGDRFPVESLIADLNWN